MNQEVRFSRLESEQRKALLIEATLACLKRHGFQGASVCKICAEAGVSVDLISHHYDGKDALVAEAHLAVTGRVMRLLRGAIDTAPDGVRPRFSVFLKASFSAELLDPQLFDARLAFWGAVGSIEAIGRVHDHSYGEYRALLVDVLWQLAEKGGWADFDAELVAISPSTPLDGLQLKSGLNPATFTPRQGMQIRETWVNGLEAGAHHRFRRATETC